MREDFSQVFLRLTPRLHRFFHSVIRAVRQCDCAIDPEDLIQLTALGAYQNSCKPKYDSYPTEVLIWEKAHNVASDHRRSLKKHQSRHTLDDAIDLVSKEADSCQIYSAKNELNQIMNSMDLKSRSLFNLYCQGYTYREMAKILKSPEALLRMMIYRKRKEISARKPDK